MRNVTSSLFPPPFKIRRIMAPPSATTVSGSLPSPKQKISPAPVAPTHRKARISTRDPPREVEQEVDRVGSWAVGEEKR